MKLSERQTQILDILEGEKFVSVASLAERTYISESSIRRDLSKLEQMGLVYRTHGGVTASNPAERVANFSQRKTKNRKGKQIIAKRAAELLRDGMSVMLDGSTTASFLIPYIAKHNGITLFTNNMEMAITAASLGIDTRCTGGRSLNGSAVLVGEGAYESISKICVDILFFSSQSLDSDGVISDSCVEENYIRSLMLSRAKKRVFLCDKEKLNKRSTYVLTTLGEVEEYIIEE